jgi:hypothetical protein
MLCGSVASKLRYRLEYRRGYSGIGEEKTLGVVFGNRIKDGVAYILLHAKAGTSGK